MTGLDLNESMIAVAREADPALEWRTGDVAAMAFEDEAFDVVLCQAALMFFPDRPAALREMWRVLRPGGRLAIQVFGESQGYEEVAGIVAEVAGEEEADLFLAPFSLRDPEEVRALFREAGIPTARVETFEGAAEYRSPEDFVRTEIDGWVLRGRIDAAAMLAASREALERYDVGDGSLAIPMEGHVVIAPRA